MEGGTVAVLVIAAIFFGAVAWIEIHSRRQSAKKEPPGSNQVAEQDPETEAPTGKKPEKKR